MNGFFSIIMPVYNGSDFLHYSIPSVLNQSYGNFEFIIIDDGSTDTSLEVIKSFEDERIRIVSKSNKGTASCYNLGISEATAEYIYLLDQDDFIEINFLESVHRIILTRDFDLIITNMQLVNYSSPMYTVNKSNIGFDEIFDDNYSFIKYYFCNLNRLGLNYSNKVFSSKILKALKFDETKIVPDISTIYKHVLMIENTAIISSATFYHVRTLDSLSRSKPTSTYILGIQTSAKELMNEFKKIDGYKYIYRLTLKNFYPSIIQNSINLLKFGIIDNSAYTYFWDYLKFSLNINCDCKSSFKYFIKVMIKISILTIMIYFHYIKNKIFRNN